MKLWISSVAKQAAAVFLALTAIATVASATTLSAEARKCGGQDNDVQAEFGIAAANQIWVEFPAFGIIPELQEDSRPAHVVVFRGAFDPRHLGAVTPGEAPTTINRVICVVQADGRPNLYYNVSRAGSGFDD